MDLISKLHKNNSVKIFKKYDAIAVEEENT